MPAPASDTIAQLFALSDVRLLDGTFRDARDRNIAYLMAHDVDRFIAPFRREAGLEPKAESYPNWESSGLDGHTAGHYLTALAQTVATTGHQEARRRLNYMLAELAACEEASDDGYFGGVPDGRALWQAVASGEIDAGSFSLNDRWVPWYNLHKTFAGLRDAWQMTGHPEAKRLLLRLTGWCAGLVENLSQEQMQEMLRSEHGGMNEVLADVHAITGDPRHLALAQRFSHRAILEPLLQSEDALTGLHANTQIPKVIGFGRIGELADNVQWTEAARFFRDTIVTHRSVAIGGNSVREHFHPRDDFSSMIESREGPETCNTYNMLRLTEQLFAETPQARYADYYERALYNHILSTQHPEHGGYVYFTPMRLRHYRVYSQAEQTFWCCVGSGMENHGRYGRFIYAHSDNALFVNLFIPSEVRWAEREVVLRQETGFPSENRTTFKLTLKKPDVFALKIRRPGWAGGKEFAVHINGEPHAVDAPAGNYFAIERQWRNGDRVEITLPMHLRLERLPDDSDYAALCYGPIVLGAPVPGETPGLVAGPGRMEHIASGKYLPLNEAPMLVGSEEAVLAGVRRVSDAELRFTAAEVLRPESFASLELVPFASLHDTRYMVYWRIAKPDRYEAIVAETAAAETERLALEARTIDQVMPGEQQPEVEHAFQGEHTATGEHLGRRWRDAGSWFGYQLKTPESDSAELIVTYDGGDENRRFSILINGQSLVEEHLTGGKPDRFVTVHYAIPQALLDAARVDGALELRFVADQQSRTARVFGIRLARPE